MTNKKSLQVKKTVLFDRNGTKTRIGSSNLPSFVFRLERCSDDTLMVSAFHEKIGELKSTVPILHLLELMGGEIKTTIVKEKCKETKVKKEKKDNTIIQNENTSTNNIKENDVSSSRIIWDGPYEGYCHKLVKIGDKACYTRFNTLQEAKIEAIKLGSKVVGGITESNGTYSLRIGNIVKSNPSSKKKAEKSWIFKEVEENTNQYTSNDVSEETENNHNTEELHTEENTEEYITKQDEQNNCLLNYLPIEDNRTNNANQENMEEYIELYSTIDTDKTLFTYSKWTYKGMSYTVLDDNIIIEKGKIIGKRFYTKDGYTATFVKEYIHK